MTTTPRGQIPRIICASCLSSALLISAGATAAAATTQPPTSTPEQQISRTDSDDSESDPGGSDTSDDALLLAQNVPPKSRDSYVDPRDYYTYPEHTAASSQRRETGEAIGQMIGEGVGALAEGELGDSLQKITGPMGKDIGGGIADFLDAFEAAATRPRTTVSPDSSVTGGVSGTGTEGTGGVSVESAERTGGVSTSSSDTSTSGGMSGTGTEGTGGVSIAGSDGTSSTS
ncbi:hypothetical protein AB0F94_14495, partial [Streptomyces sp. NPDC024089]